MGCLWYIFNITFPVFPVVTCPSIKTSLGEKYNDTTCTSHSKVFNDTCTLSCTLGYNQTSTDNVHRCTDHGNWSNDVMCERKLHLLTIHSSQRHCPSNVKTMDDSSNYFVTHEPCWLDVQYISSLCQLSSFSVSTYIHILE